MRTEESKKLLNEFLGNLKMASEQRGYQFDPKPTYIKRLQLYDFLINNRTYALFIHVSRDRGFWGVPSRYQEVFNELSQFKELNRDWAVILLQEPMGKNNPLGYLISSNEFLEKKAEFSINRKGWIVISEKQLPLKNQFNNWDTFFQLLNRST